ncbi:hypothetical protein HNQ91_003925 [Filimonas zeae]|nr:hypothetical protein [Filimonas zeae]
MNEGCLFNKHHRDGEGQNSELFPFATVALMLFIIREHIL